jgi:hypothetical protein
MIKFWKASTILLLLMTSGIPFFIVGRIHDHTWRYTIFDVYQLGVSKAFDVVDWKFGTTKANTIAASNEQIAPIVNWLASFLWTVVLFAVAILRRRKAFRIHIDDYWSQVSALNFVLSLFIVGVWVVFMDLDLIYDGSTSLYERLMWILYCPSLVPEILGHLALESGGDSHHGYDDMILMSRVNFSFAVTVWSMVITLFWHRDEFSELIFVNRSHAKEQKKNDE